MPQATAVSTKQSSMALTCQATPSKLAGPSQFSADNVSVNVTSPEQAKVGEEFDTVFSINPVNVPIPALPLGARITEASRMKLDFQLPGNADFVSASVDETGANVTGFKVLRVNDSGVEDPSGRILRLTSQDNATIGNSPNSSTSHSGGVTYKVSGSSLNLVFPTITLRVKGTEPGDMDFGVRTAGAAGDFNTSENFLTMLAKVKASILTINAPTKCSPRPKADAPIDERAGKLATVKIESDGKDTDTEIAETPVDVTVEAPDSVPARSAFTVTAKVTDGARGTVEFSFNGATETVEVDNGVATASLHSGAAGDNVQLKAVFHPASGSSFAQAQQTRTINVTPLADTTMTLSVEEGKHYPGQPVGITADIVPAENTLVADGTVELVFDGVTKKAEVKDNKASFTVTPDRAEAFDITARFIPAGRDQTPAEAETTLSVVGQADTTINATLPAAIEPMVPAETAIEVSPAVDGAVVARIQGRPIRGTVTAGKATLPLVFPAAGDYDVEFVFTPDNANEAATAKTVVKAQVAPSAYTSVSLAVDGPTTAVAGEKTAFVVTTTPNAGQSRNVTGYLALSRNGERMVNDGEEVKIPVLEGVADFDLTWKNAGKETLTLEFFNTDNEKLGKTSHTVDVTVAASETEQTPETDTVAETGTDAGAETGTDAGSDDPVVDGDLPETPDNGSSNGSSATSGSPSPNSIKAFFERMWQWIVNLFTGRL